jgi:hypothetical protein
MITKQDRLRQFGTADFFEGGRIQHQQEGGALVGVQDDGEDDAVVFGGAAGCAHEDGFAGVAAFFIPGLALAAADRHFGNLVVKALPLAGLMLERRRSR